MKLWTYIIEKILSLVSIYYQLQSNGAALLFRLSDKYAFLDLDLDKI